MTHCYNCGLEDANHYFDGTDYWCQICYEEMKAEERQEWKEEHGTN